MLTRLHRQILKGLPLPFVAALLTLLFLLLMQFLIHYLPDLVGRGLPPVAVAELIAYSLAYMVTLAVPMAWLVALLASFGRLAESRGYLVAKSAGISLPRLAWPALAVGLVLTGGMVYFNNQMLPEANYRLNGLWRDIRVSRPGFALTPGEFYTDVNGYAIRAEAIPPDSAGLLLGVTVFESGTGGDTATLTAARARLQSQYGGQRLTMLLEDGAIHRRAPDDGADRYERLTFDRHRMAFDLSGLSGFERRDTDNGGSRTDRSMRTTDMLAVVDSLDQLTASQADSIRSALDRWYEPPVASAVLRFATDSTQTAENARIGADRPALAGLADRRSTTRRSSAPVPSADAPRARSRRSPTTASGPTASGSRSTKRTPSRWPASCSCWWACRWGWLCPARASGWWRRWPCSCSCSTGSRWSAARSWPTARCCRPRSACGWRTSSSACWGPTSSSARRATRPGATRCERWPGGSSGGSSGSPTSARPPGCPW